MRLVQNDSTLYCTSINEIDDFLRQTKAERLLPDDDGDLRAMLLGRVPEHYHDLLDVFSKVESDQVPPLRPESDHDIELEGDPRTLGYSPLYKMTEEELEACKRIPKCACAIHICSGFGTVSFKVSFLGSPPRLCFVAEQFAIDL